LRSVKAYQKDADDGWSGEERYEDGQVVAHAQN
jgi:hypothetical protein